MKTTRDCMNAISDSKILYELNDMERKALQECLLDIYGDIAEVCKKYNLKVMLAGGSALGAIRHKGFIPWDDDLDLIMLREEYEEFIKVFQKEKGESYVLYAPSSKEGITHRFAKVVKKNTKLIDIYNVASKFEKGVFIDIFPLDVAPKNMVVRKIKGVLADVIGVIGTSVYLKKFDNDIMRDFMHASENSRKNYKLRMLIGTIFSVISFEKWYKFYDRFVQSNKKTGYYCIPTGRKRYLGEVLEEKVYSPPLEVEFEGMKVMVPHDVDKYLRNLYGEYMEIPPKEKRERHYFIELQL